MLGCSVCFVLIACRLCCCFLSCGWCAYDFRLLGVVRCFVVHFSGLS